MKKHAIKGKQLRSLGYPEGPVIGLAMNVMAKQYKRHTQAEVLALLKQVLENPGAYSEDPYLSVIALRLLPDPVETDTVLSLNNSGVRFGIFGEQGIEAPALDQMYMAARLPVAVAGALMPDAHSGYGLPIGGVLATDGAVIPYGVGVDIGCRMCLSIFDIDPGELVQKEAVFVRMIQEHTLFGSGAGFDHASDHEVMENETFRSTPLLKGLHGRAWKQLGSSGSGNHFVELGVARISQRDPVLGIDPGEYLGLLSHSGSRALGAHIANYFTKIAISKRRLPKETRNLAWLDLKEEPGAAYWEAMNLAGAYAAACHEVIHGKIARALGRAPVKRVENHHNFAWVEQWEGKEVIVHRKGATPAGKGVLGIIPGSMTADGFIVKGKGCPGALHSAAHGAGRRMSRSRAIASVTERQFKQELDKFGVRLLGGGIDESPFAYKDIEQVMRFQDALVEVVGRFTPRIVKMDGAAHRGWKKGDFLNNSINQK